MVVFVIHEMDSASTHLDSVGKDRPMNVEAEKSLSGKRRNQCRMDIDHPVCEIGWDEDMFEKTAHEDVIDSGVATRRKDLIAKRFRTHARLAADDFGRNLCRLGIRESARFRIAGNDQLKIDIEFPRGLLLEKIAECRASAGDQN